MNTYIIYNGFLIYIFILNSKLVRSGFSLGNLLNRIGGSSSNNSGNNHQQDNLNDSVFNQSSSGNSSQSSQGPGEAGGSSGESINNQLEKLDKRVKDLENKLKENINLTEENKKLKEENEKLKKQINDGQKTEIVTDGSGKVGEGTPTTTGAPTATTAEETTPSEDKSTVATTAEAPPSESAAEPAEGTPKTEPEASLKPEQEDTSKTGAETEADKPEEDTEKASDQDTTTGDDDSAKLDDDTSKTEQQDSTESGVETEDSKSEEDSEKTSTESDGSTPTEGSEVDQSKTETEQPSQPTVESSKPSGSSAPFPIVVDDSSSSPTDGTAGGDGLSAEAVTPVTPLEPTSPTPTVGVTSPPEEPEPTKSDADQSVSEGPEEAPSSPTPSGSAPPITLTVVDDPTKTKVDTSMTSTESDETKGGVEEGTSIEDLKPSGLSETGGESVEEPKPAQGQSEASVEESKPADGPSDEHVESDKSTTSADVQADQSGESKEAEHKEESDQSTVETKEMTEQKEESEQKEEGDNEEDENEQDEDEEDDEDEGGVTGYSGKHGSTHGLYGHSHGSGGGLPSSGGPDGTTHPSGGLTGSGISHTSMPGTYTDQYGTSTHLSSGDKDGMSSHRSGGLHGPSGGSEFGMTGSEIGSTSGGAAVSQLSTESEGKSGLISGLFGRSGSSSGSSWFSFRKKKKTNESDGQENSTGTPPTFNQPQMKELDSDQHPQNIKIFTQDPNDANNTVELDKSKYTVKQGDDKEVFLYEFKDGAKCTKVTCEGNDVWKYVKTKNEVKYPESIKYNKAIPKIIFIFDGLVGICEKDGDNWKCDDSKRVSIELDIKNNTSSTDKFVYNKSDKVVTYTAKGNNAFNIVKFNGKVIWKTDQSNEYGIKVTLYGKGSKNKVVLIDLIDGSNKIFQRGGKDKQWIELDNSKGIPVSININFHDDCYKYSSVVCGNVRIFTPKKGFVFNFVNKEGIVIWKTDNSVEYSKKVEVKGTSNITIHIGDGDKASKKVFKKVTKNNSDYDHHWVENTSESTSANNGATSDGKTT